MSQFDHLPLRSRTVATALVAAGIEPDIHELADSTRTAAEAAAALDCEVGAIASSLVFSCDGEPVLVMTSGRHRVDLRLLATHLGDRPVVRATPEQVRDATGQAIGGVAPVGHPVPLRTFVDAALNEHPRLWASAGTPHTVFPLSYDELVSLTGGTPIVVSA
jgi:prolyl-tRNA editing enzyme YbaK/EbsC (Cys-tRNA(Pro) deacylase)